MSLTVLPIYSETVEDDNRTILRGVLYAFGAGAGFAVAAVIALALVLFVIGAIIVVLFAPGSMT